MKRILAGVALVVILIMTLLPLDVSFNYFISMLLFFATIVYIFYLNRNELLLIKGEEVLTTLSFVNKSFFKRKDIVISREKLKAVKSGDIISLSTDSAIVALIRKKSVSDEAWNELNDYFKPENGPHI